MSYLGDPFQHDLFISYSHGSLDGVGASPIKTYSQALVRELELELRTDPNFQDLKVFLDEDHRRGQGVDPMEPLSEGLKADIESTGILTILMSPHYMRSKWCGDERDWWLESKAKDPIDDRNRIAVARIWPTDEAWPAALTDSQGAHLPGFKFHGDERPQPFEWPDPTGAKGPLREALLDMVGSVWNELRTFKRRLEEERKHLDEAERLAAAAGQMIYLHAREDHAAEWEQANDALTERGFAVLPTDPEPQTRDPAERREMTEYRIETMATCDGVLLLGTGDGRAVDLDLAVIGRGDRHAARERSNRMLPCGLLDTVGEDLSTPRRRKLVQRLGINWIDARAEHWTSDVSEWLREASTFLEPRT